MPDHERSIGYIAWEILHWQVQHIKDWAPFIDPGPENAGPPQWWYNFYSDWDWWRMIGPGNVPYSSLISMAMRATWQLLGMWVDEVGDWAVSSAESAVRGWMGYVFEGYTTFSLWIWSIRARVGSFVPHFADTIADAAVWLYLKLPGDIRDATVTWYDKFSAWYNAAISWAQVTYDQAKIWATLAFNWVADTGSKLNSWYSGAHTWLDDFRNNAAARVVGYLGVAWIWLVDFRDNYYARIIGWLGSPWSKLMAFTGGALTFFLNLWWAHASEIGAFWGDPLLWLYDRVEAELVRRW